MTTELQQRIAAIKAECEEILRLSEKATPGPWVVEDTRTRVYVGNKSTQSCGLWHIIYGVDISGLKFEPAVQHGVDARFIAHSRNVSPAMARVVVAAIDFWQLGPAAGYVVRETADAALESIANQWEGKP